MLLNFFCLLVVVRGGDPWIELCTILVDGDPTTRAAVRFGLVDGAQNVSFCKYASGHPHIFVGIEPW